PRAGPTSEPSGLNEPKRLEPVPANTKQGDALTPSGTPLPVLPPPPEPERKLVPTPATPATPVASALPDQLPLPTPERVPGPAPPSPTLQQPTATPPPPADVAPSNDRPAGAATLRPPGPPPAGDNASERLRLGTPITAPPPPNQLAQGPVP